MLKKNQKTNKKPSFKRRPLLIIGLILLMAVVALTTAKILASISRNNTNNTPEDTIEVTDQTGAGAEVATHNTEDPNDKTPKQYEGPDVNTLDYLSGVITYAGATDNYLSINTTINQYLNTGTCELTLTQGGRTVSRTADIIANPSSSTCDGFSVPLSELGGGNWSINIRLTSGDKNGTITGEVSL
jgi:flagellar basal body-associated protein FliL